MNAYDKSVLKEALTAAAVISVIYAVIVIIIAQFHFYAYYALCGVPIVFALMCSFYYALKQDFIKFLTSAAVKEWCDDPEISYYTSDYKKELAAVSLPVICFFPTLVFYFLFSWIFLIKNR